MQVDREVEATRSKLLRYLNIGPHHYVASFTLNTTYGINLILSQLSPNGIRRVITSDIEHNSVFLPTMAFARRHNVPRIVISRNTDGSLPLDEDFDGALVVVNAVSNIDGRELGNIAELVKAVHKAGGLIVVDGAQTLAHSKRLLMKTEADAICFSAHKMYAPSLGGMIIKKSLLERLEAEFIGGGMVTDVTEAEYTLSTNEPHTRLEAGLQAYGEIIALGAALDWLEVQQKQDATTELKRLGGKLYDFLYAHPKVTLVNTQSSSTLCFYHQDLDAHLLARVLSDEKIMVRSGYFCCHYYLKHKLSLPPLVRLSLGLHTREEDITKTITVLERVL